MTGIVHKIRLEYGKVDRNDGVIASQKPAISWAVLSTAQNVYQSAYRIHVKCGDNLLWDSQWVESDMQQCIYNGKNFVPGRKNELQIMVRDQEGAEYQSEGIHFYYGTLEEWPARWISGEENLTSKVHYFEREFIAEDVETVHLYSCGLAYQKVFINDQPVEGRFLDPAFSQYDQRAYYVMFPELEGYIRPGKNKLTIQVGAGWRTPENVCYRDYISDYTGPTQLSAALQLIGMEGREEWLCTDENWQCYNGPIVRSNIFDGEVYDARSISEVCPVLLMKSPTEKLMLQTLEPVCNQEEYKAVSVSQIRQGVWSVDFGQNIAGVCRLYLPRTMKRGQRITITHMEWLDEDGSLYMDPLRKAKSCDEYIAVGDERDLKIWEPQFTYHGFRYVEVRGLEGPLKKEDILAISRYTDVENDSDFRCGNALVNAIHHNVVQTEKANIHSILTDCPQRDERMGWLNDATVRFEETPYNFDIGRLFPKVVRDVMDVQSADGAITCTAPFAFGSRPADPVCSSYLVAAKEAWMHTGNKEILAEGYEGFKAWDDCLENNSEDHIVQYSYYGDWAGPAYVCHGMCDAVSQVTLGILMSTGYHYYNNLLLEQFAKVLGKEEDARMFRERAKAIQIAFLKKWYDGETGKVATGSQGCQVFALWLGILPEEDRQKAAEVLHQDLVERNYKFTTGNLCTRYLYDVLSQYGYLEDAWRLITSEEYPSLGYMIQQEATTIWERFELKKSASMNSHNHPMYGAVDYWFYAYLLGVKPLESGWKKAQIRPYMPEKLLSAQGTVETVLGDITVRWVKQYEQVDLHVTIPFGMTADVHTPSGIYTVGSGFYHYHWTL